MGGDQLGGEAPATLPRLLGSPYRILVAEDDASFLERIALVLEQDERFAVVARACNGREAVELAAETAPDAIVMDVEMPVL
ncbi:MAG: response regulator, partial [Gaiellaceae bacterium]